MINLDQIKSVALLYLNMDIDQYLSKKNKQIVLYNLSYPKKQFVYLGGLDSKDLNMQMDSNFRFSRPYNYGLYVEQNINEQVVDVLAFNSRLRTDKIKELIIIHELCHLLEQTGYYKEIGIELSAIDLDFGVEIQRIANKFAELQGLFGDPYHNEIFGALLHWGVGNYNNGDKYKNLAKSMEYNFGPYSKKIEKFKPS